MRGVAAAGDWRSRLDWQGGDQYPITLPRTPQFRGLPITAYGAEVADESCNLVCAEGGVLICVPLEALGRPLRHGEAVILVTEQAGLFERRCMTATADPHGGIVLTAPTDRRDYHHAAALRPPDRRPGALHDRSHRYTADDALVYEPAEDDPQRITAVVPARIAPY